MLQAAILSLRVAPTEVKRRVREVTRAQLGPEFTRQVAQRASESNQPKHSAAVLTRGSALQVSNQNVTMRAAASTRRLRGGLVPDVLGKGVEFGAVPRTTTYKRRSRKGRTHEVTRNTTAQWPRRRARGWAFFPTVNKVTPRFTALWAQTAIRTVHEAFEGRR